MIDRIRKKPIEVQRITLKNLQYNALALLLENVLFSMVKFDEPEVREEGIKRILAIRYVYIYSYKTGWSTCANLLKHFKDYIWFHQILLKQNKLHWKIKLKLFFIFFQKREASQEKILKDPNDQLSSWTDLIDLSVNGVCEPPLTLDFSDDELQNSLLTGEKINLPDFPSHSQGVERRLLNPCMALKQGTSTYLQKFCANNWDQRFHLRAHIWNYLIPYIKNY